MDPTVLQAENVRLRQQIEQLENVMKLQQERTTQYYRKCLEQTNVLQNDLQNLQAQHYDKLREVVAMNRQIQGMRRSSSVALSQSQAELLQSRLNIRDRAASTKKISPISSPQITKME